jgi:hypothetical protein
VARPNLESGELTGQGRLSSEKLAAAKAYPEISFTPGGDDRASREVVDQWGEFDKKITSY